jgi:hypothetical protein
VKPRLSRPFYIAAFVVVLLILLQTLALLMSRAPAVSYPDPQSYSYYGWRAAFTTLQKAGLPLQDLRLPFHRSQIPRSSVFIVAAPRTSFGYDEARALREWLDDGGVLVFFTGSAQSFQQWAAESNLHAWVFPSLGSSSQTVGGDTVFVTPKSPEGKPLTLVARHPAREFACSRFKECFLTDSNDRVHGAVFERGMGFAYWYSSPDFLANGNITNADNFTYFYRFFNDLLRERLTAFPNHSPAFYLDFFHHGHLAPGAFRGWLERPYLLYLLIVLFIWTFSERKGIVRYLPPEKAFRGSDATVAMVARLWAHRDNAPWLLQQMKAYYERRFRKMRRNTAPLESAYHQAARRPGAPEGLVEFARSVSRLQEG